MEVLLSLSRVALPEEVLATGLFSDVCPLSCDACAAGAPAPAPGDGCTDDATGILAGVTLSTPRRGPESRVDPL